MGRERTVGWGVDVLGMSAIMVDARDLKLKATWKVTFPAIPTPPTITPIPPHAHKTPDLEPPTFPCLSPARPTCPVDLLLLSHGLPDCRNPPNDLVPWHARVDDTRPLFLLHEVVRVADPRGVHADENFCGVRRT